MSFAQEVDVLPGAEIVTLLTVPRDRRFVLTDLEVQSDGPVFHLAEARDGKILFRRFDFGEASFHSSVGIAFAPGTAVVLDPLIRTPTGSSTYLVRFNVIGYLTSI